jgi:ATP-dependent Lhr-like helicase
MAAVDLQEALTYLSGPVRDWFARTYPRGPTAAQSMAWPVIAEGSHLLLVSPTGTGKTLAAFLAIINRLFSEHFAGTLQPGLRCVYVSPLRSLGYDIERNLAQPLEAIRRALELAKCPIRVGVRTGDTSAHLRRALRLDPPHLLITTPESLSLMLSQTAWSGHWRSVRQVIVDEIHALVPNKRGADLSLSLERLAAAAQGDPARIGLSATCRPVEPVAEFLVGRARTCRVVDASQPFGVPHESNSRGTPLDRSRPSTEIQRLNLQVESLLKPDEAPHRGLTYRRLLKRLVGLIEHHRTTVIFANTRAFTEKLTHDLRLMLSSSPESIAAHHSALDANRRRAVEQALKSGQLRAVITSTSLELGVDIGTADLTVLVGLPGSVSRCLQRVGRSGHRPGSIAEGLILAASPSELAGAAVTAQAALERRVEPLRTPNAPLDVLCQQLIGMACQREWGADEAFELTRHARPFASLARSDFDACLDFLAGELSSPAGAYEPEPRAAPRWSSPRIWRRLGRFAVRSRRVVRWFATNVGTITSEETVRVVADNAEIGTLEGSYAERLLAGDCFLLDGRAFEFRRLEGLVVDARAASGDPTLPRWSSDRQSLSAALARELAAFRERSAEMAAEGPGALRSWLCDAYDLSSSDGALLCDLFEAQEVQSEIPRPGTLLVEESPHAEGASYAFHAPLARSACEAAARAIAARLGRQLGYNLTLSVADLGWSIHLPHPARLLAEDIAPLLAPERFAADVLEGLDRGELLARRFRHVASTAMMVLRRPEGGRTRVGGLLWVSNRLYPLLRALCPGHPLLRETKREVLEDLLDTQSALSWLATSPRVHFRSLDAPSPFTAAWIDPSGPEPLRFESPAEALRKLHQRITIGSK